MGTAVLLVDNGSLQPAATLALRTLAAALAAAIGRPVEPVSLLHSSAVPPERLGGVPAEILEPALRRRLAAGAEDFLLLPLFLGPSAALSEYIPERVQALRAAHPRLRLRLAPPLAPSAAALDPRLLTVVEDRIRERLGAGPPPAVVLVDHGSPRPEVTAVRDSVAAHLSSRLGAAVSGVMAASMERRPGEAYAFNEPLLSTAVARLAAGGAARILLAPFFLQPGRHAGPGGDLERIAAEAAAPWPGLHLESAELIGGHPALLPLLAERYRQGLESAPL